MVKDDDSPRRDCAWRHAVGWAIVSVFIAGAASCSSDAPASPAVVPTGPTDVAAVAPAPPPEPVPEPSTAAPALPGVPGIYLRRGDTWEPTIVRIRNTFDGTYGGTAGMPPAGMPTCDDPCRFLILDMPTIDTTALYRGMANQRAVFGAPASQYPWQAEADRARPLHVEALRPGAYTVEIAASTGHGGFDFAALVAEQGGFNARAVFFIIRRLQRGAALTGQTPGNAQAGLAPEDATFVDTQGGRGWGNRCFAHLGANHLDAAQAACDRGLAQATDQAVRGSLLYNAGRVAEARGERDRARELYRQSLTARPGNRVVQAHLDTLSQVDATAPMTPVAPPSAAQPSPPVPAPRVGPDTVRDNASGLLMQYGFSPGSQSQQASIAYCANLRLTGGGWRLPTKDELFAVHDNSANLASSDDDFWSSSHDSPTYGWTVAFNGGLQREYPMTDSNRARCVR